jgi:nucleoside-diphosphate-sugar epimerase
MQVRDRGAHETLARWGAAGTVIDATLTTAADVRALVHDAGPDVVFNLAGYGVDRAERDDDAARWMNGEFPAALASACADLPPSVRKGPRLVHVGSALEYGSAGGVLREDTPCQPTSLYSRTKLAGTEGVRRVCEERGLAAVVARPFTVFGPGEHEGRLFPSLMRAARERTDLPLSEGLQRRDFAFVGDVADALVALATSPHMASGDVVNVATGSMHAVRDFAHTTSVVLGMPAERLRFGALPGYPDEMAHERVSVARYRDRTGRSLPMDLTDAITRAVDAWDTLCS